MYLCLLNAATGLKRVAFKMITIIHNWQNADIFWYFIIGFWLLFCVIQLFLAYGTAYRCTKKGNDNGAALFIYLIGFSFAALIPGLGLHYYIRHLPPKQVIVKQTVQPSVVKIVEQAPPQEIYAQTVQAGYVPGQGQPIYIQQGQPVQGQMTQQQYQQAVIRQQQMVQQPAAMQQQQSYNQSQSDDKKKQ